MYTDVLFWLQLGVVALQVLFGFYLKNYLPKYFEEKGKNLATKEDIGEITTIVETVKSDLLQETEKLKSQLSYVNQNKISIKNSEREALFKLNETFAGWIYSIMHFQTGLYTEDNFTEINKIPGMLEEKGYDVDISRAKLLLFMHDQELLNHIKELSQATITMESIVMECVINLYYVYKTNQTWFQFKTPEQNALERAKQTIDQIAKIQNKMLSERNLQFETVNDFHLKLIVLIKQRVATLEN